MRSYQERKENVRRILSLEEDTPITRWKKSKPFVWGLTIGIILGMLPLIPFTIAIIITYACHMFYIWYGKK